MIFKDITTDTQKKYHLNTQERCVFFLFNRSGTITFELAGESAEAHIFAFFIGSNNDLLKLNIIQKHKTPKTISHALVKSVLFDAAEFSYDGLIQISESATQTDATQESRSLLLSQSAKIYTRPALEILTNDVRCRHAATVSQLDADQLFFAQSRGLSAAQSQLLLVQGFFTEALEKIAALGVPTDTLYDQFMPTLLPLISKP